MFLRRVALLLLLPLVKMVSADAAKHHILVIPGGGLDGIQPAPWTIARCEAALETYNRLRKGAGEDAGDDSGADGAPRVSIVTLSLGTPHKPFPVNENNGFQVTEAESAGKWLIQNGVNPEHVFEEGASLDTIGNAYWFRLIHMEPMIERWGKLVRMATGIERLGKSSEEGKLWKLYTTMGSCPT